MTGETWRTLLQTFRTKIFLALSNDFSAKVASELCGQDEKWRVNYNISESGHDSRVSYLTGKPLRAQGFGWKKISREMGIGVGTLYRLAGKGSNTQERDF